MDNFWQILKKAASEHLEGVKGYPLIPSPTAKVPWAVLGKIKYANTGIFQLCAELQCEMQEYLSMSSDLWKYWQNDSFILISLMTRKLVVTFIMTVDSTPDHSIPS